MAYFSGQGRVLVSDRDVSGNFTAFRLVGNVPLFKVTTKVDFTEHKEATTGNRLVDMRVPKMTSASVDMTLEDFTAKNLIAAFYGDSTVDAGATISVSPGEALPAGLAQNDYVRLKNGNISAVTVKDSAAATKVLGTDYTIDSASAGTLKIIAASVTNQPWVVGYTYATQTRVRMLTTTVVERWVRFEGINTGDPALSKCLVELYRVQFDPAKDFNAISDDVEKFELTGNVLFDSAKAVDATLGGFGKVVML